MSGRTAEEALLTQFAELVQPFRLWHESTVLAGGATHESWRMSPFPVVFERAQGVEKWDCSGRRYLDLWMGHGSLLLGNAHPAVVEAVARQMALGQHVGGAHTLQYRWAERIREFVPSCESIRFTASGTEATLLALRIARSWTRRPRVVRIDGHFHGWHDDALAHLVTEAAGLNPGTDQFISVVPPLDTGAAEDELTKGDVAALILEPGGGSAGALPWSAPYLASLRALADATGTLLVFDEVISGFRYAPGGAQQLASVSPDLTVLAKIATGGMPGGIVGGRSDIMKVLGSDSSAGLAPHTGTFNGFSLSAAAALETIDRIADGRAQSASEEAARSIVEGINTAAEANGVDVRAFHQSSIFHLLVGAVGDGSPVGPGPAAIRLQRDRSAAYQILRCALLLEGIDCHRSHGWLSAAHGSAEVAEAINGFERAFLRLRQIESFRAAPAAKIDSKKTPGDCHVTCPDPLCGARFRSVGSCSLPLDGRHLDAQGHP